MTRTCLLVVAAGALALAPAAFAQTSGSSGPNFGEGGGASAATGRVLVDLDRIPNADARRGPGQTPRELMATSLLNNLSGYGFSDVRNFHKSGQNYVADVQNRDGRWMTVQIDPNTGTIATLR